MQKRRTETEIRKKKTDKDSEGEDERNDSGNSGNI